MASMLIMPSDKPQKNYQEFWMAVSFVLGFYVLYYQNKERERIVNAVKTHKIDTIATNDSVYIIYAKVDTVYYARQK